MATDEATRASLDVDGKIPALVVYPAAAEQVAVVLAFASDHDLAVIPCRNATKLGVGNPPRRYDIALCLKEMNRVSHYEPDDLTVSAEPGMEFGDFQRFVSGHDLWLPLDPPGGARASLGGIVATNSTGPLRLLYGAPRDMVLGMKIATCEGKLIKAGGRVVKNVAGYDLGKLLIGSYGTLGVIVEVSFKLYPLPARRATFVMPTGTLGIARHLRRRILHSPLSPMRMVLLDALASARIRRGTPLAGEANEPEIWVQFGGSERVLERCVRELEELGAAAGARLHRLSGENAELIWSRISGFRGWLAEAYPGAVILKAVLPDSSSEEFLSRACQEAENEIVTLLSSVQMGVGIVHLGFLGDYALPTAPSLIERLRRAAQGLGGALVVQHCPAGVRERVEVWGAPGDDFEVMAKLKATWDPKGILSPGRFVGSL